jgi:thiol-disulfide isomerase/thioredoxin/uncharacterized protein YlbG (UPF0298 family)
MFKKVVFTLFFVSLVAHSQHVVKGSFVKNANYKWVILYQLQGVNQKYIANTDVVNGEFSFEISENEPKGMYRLTYEIGNDGYVDVLLNSETVVLEFDPKNQFETLQFTSSNENITYQLYLKESEVLRQKLDAIQLAYFKTVDASEKENLETQYKTALNNYKNTQLLYEEKAEEMLAFHFIKAHQKYYAPQLFTVPQAYLTSEKSHFFDFIDFNDNALRNSTVLNQKVIDYVFYLSHSDDAQVQTALYKNAVVEVLEHIGENNLVLSEISTTLMFAFAQVQHVALVDFLLSSIYKKLPPEYIDATIVAEIENRIKLAVGKIAPDFTWTKNKKQFKLSEFQVSDTYILVFWSTTCSHCLVEIPDLYEYTKNNKNIHVISVALENDTVGYNLYAEKFTNWTNVLGLKKWENSIAKMYNITATPTYFVLNKSKMIIAKPDHIKDVKAFLLENDLQN